MRLKQKLLMGAVIFLISAPVIFLLVQGHTAKTFFESQSLRIQSFELDSLMIDEELHLVYTKGNTIHYKVQKLTGEILIEHSIESDTPINLQLYLNDSVMILWESVNQIFMSNIASSWLFGDGEKPRTFENNNDLYISYIKNDILYCHKFSQKNSLWIIDTSVENYFITGTESYTYFTYTKNGVIHYRICYFSLWKPANQFIAGLYPVIVPAEELDLMYLFYYSNNSLQVGYGASDITHVKPLMSGRITHINAYPSNPALVIFVCNNDIYLQEITNEGFSKPFEICQGEEPQLHFFRDLILIVYRDGFTFYSLIIKQSDKMYYDFSPIKLDSLSTQDYDFQTWIGRYNEYYSLVYEQWDFLQNSDLGVWLIEHPIWLTLIFWVGGLLMLFALFFAIRWLFRFFQAKRKGTGVAA